MRGTASSRACVTVVAARSSPRRQSTTKHARRAHTTPRAIGVNDDVVTSSSSSADSLENDALKTEIYALAACAGRGETATTRQRDEMRALLRSLKNPTAMPARDERLHGTWELVYESSGFPFRSSPFFWAVGKLLGENADFFYGAHEHQTSMFGGGCGTCLQKISLGRLESDCVVKASLGVPLFGFAPLFAGYGSVITKGTSRVLDDDTIAMPVGSLSTTVRQDDANVLPALNFLNGTTVPVGNVMGQITDAESEVTMRITYLDENMRVSELEDGTQLVYCRRDA
jgi:hypothetical protein